MVLQALHGPSLCRARPPPPAALGRRRHPLPLLRNPSPRPSRALGILPPVHLQALPHSFCLRPPPLPTTLPHSPAAKAASIPFPLLSSPVLIRVTPQSLRLAIPHADVTWCCGSNHVPCQGEGGEKDLVTCLDKGVGRQGCVSLIFIALSLS